MGEGTIFATGPAPGRRACLLAIALLWLGLLLSSPPAIAVDVTPSVVPGIDSSTVRIGVLAFRGSEQAMHRWQPLADFLNRSLPQHLFRIVPLNLAQMSEAVADGRVDFVLTNPGNYVLLESRYGISRIATLKRHWKDHEYSQYGAVIFTRRDNEAITRLADLRGHSLMVVNDKAFGGFQMAWRELRDAGVDPFTDLSALRFNGFPQDNIVHAVLAGQVDAGTVRTGVLEYLALNDKIDLAQIRVLNPLNPAEFQFLLSTRLYPEWPLAKTRGTPDRLATEVVVSLFSAPELEFAVSASDWLSWTIPLDYSGVHELMRELQIGPYHRDQQISVTRLLTEYWKWLVTFVAVLLGLSLLSGYVMQVNRRLREAQRKLQEHRDVLEQRVAERTSSLIEVNRELEEDIAARIRAEKSLKHSERTLRELNRIASVFPAQLEEKIESLLILGRNHFGFAVATLYRRDGNQVNAVARVGQPPGSATVELPIDSTRFDELLAGAELLIQQSRGNGADVSPGEQSCVAVKVMVEGRPYGFLCLTDIGTGERHLDKVDRDILQLLADWIGMEIARKQTSDREQQHLADLAHVSRLSTMGEMASGLAHELNQPLTAIANYMRGSLRRMEAGNLAAAEMQEIMGRSVREAERAAEIIRRMRAFVNKSDPHRERIDLGALVRQASRYFSGELERNDIELILDIAPIEQTVTGDAIQIEQVLLNLLSNAREAMRQPRGKTRRITIVTRPDADGVTVEVRDTGCGLPEGDAGRIFEPFFTTRDEGMGMGLSISRTIIEAHGGRMYTESNGEFTGIGFILPADQE